MEKLTKPAAIPRLTIRLHVAVQILAGLVLLGAANFFSFNHYFRGDFSRSQKFVLSYQTRRVLQELKTPVQVTVFFSQTRVAPETQLYPDVQNLLKELAFSGRENFLVETIDPTRDLSRARELQGKYKFNAAENVIILDYDGRTQFVPVAEMGDFDMSPVLSGGMPRLLAFKGEQALTKSLLALVRPDRLSACFLQGHGEPDVGPASPIARFTEYIARQNVTVSPLTLGSADQIPAECEALVIIAPQTDLTEREAEILRNFWEKGGRLLVLLDPKASTPRLTGLLRGASIVPRDDRVLRILNNPLLGNVTGIWRTVTGEFLPNNAVTKRLAGLNIILPGETQSLALDEEQSRGSGILLWPLIVAAEAFWGESEYITDEKAGVHYEEGRDAGYPVYVAAAASRGGVNDDRVEIASAKMVVVGSCEFALDAVLTPQGLDFLLSSMNWLLDRGQLTGVMPKTVQNFSLNLSDQQLGTLTLWIIIVIPGAAALCGGIAWWRRRQ
jgi:hypothetical protein